MALDFAQIDGLGSVTGATVRISMEIEALGRELREYSMLSTDPQCVDTLARMSVLVADSIEKRLTIEAIAD